MLMPTAMALLLAAVFGQVAAQPERAQSAFSEDRSRRFDFWVGRWDVTLRMPQDDGELRDSVRAEASIYSILGGRAILELWDSDPIKGYSLRYYDPGLAKWVLWLNWPSENRAQTSSLEGSFRHGRGDFFSQREQEDGSVLKSRFSFNDITPFSLRWDDHYSTDGGKNWRPNWVMEFSRLAVEPEWPIPVTRVPTMSSAERCTLDAFRSYESVVGEWTGLVRVRGRSVPATLRAYRILDGCAVVGFVSADGLERFVFLSYDTAREHWTLDWMTDDEASSLDRYAAAEDWRRLAPLSGDGGFRWESGPDRLEYRVGRVGSREEGQFERASPLR